MKSNKRYSGKAIKRFLDAAPKTTTIFCGQCGASSDAEPDGKWQRDGDMVTCRVEGHPAPHFRG